MENASKVSPSVQALQASSRQRRPGGYEILTTVPPLSCLTLTERQGDDGNPPDEVQPRTTGCHHQRAVRLLCCRFPHHSRGPKSDHRLSNPCPSTVSMYVDLSALAEKGVMAQCPFSRALTSLRPCLLASVVSPASQIITGSLLTLPRACFSASTDSPLLTSSVLQVPRLSRWLLRDFLLGWGDGGG